MFKKSTVTLLTTLSLASAFTAHAATIPISSLPITISAPGTYVLKSNLTYTGGINSGFQAAIAISGSVVGTVIIDLQGFTITNAGSNIPSNGNYAIGVFSLFNGPSPKVTIRNGKIANFVTGVEDYFSGITVSHIIFNQNCIGITLSKVANANINNCQFNGFGFIENFASYGINDNLPVGNVYKYLTFSNTIVPIDVEMNEGNNTASTTPLLLNSLQFAPPPAN
jgi:hypothetical protein